MERETRNSLFYLGLVMVIGLISFYLVRPVLPYLLGAFMVVYVTYPVYERLCGYLNHSGAAAWGTVLAILLAVIIPSALLVGVAVDQSSRAASAVTSNGVQNLDIGSLELQLEDMTGRELGLQERVETGLSNLANSLSSQAGALAGAALEFMIGIFVMVFTMFYLYQDGPQAVGAVQELLPLREDRKEMLFDELEKVTGAVLVGHVLTSLVQGVVGAAGFYVFGVSNAIFWGAVMVVLALIPMVGPFVLYLPAGAYAALQGDVPRGIGLIFYGIVVVSLVDNLVRPYLVERRAKIHPVITLVGVIGGLSLMGIVGLFVGPLILAIFVATLRAYLGDVRGETGGPGAG